MMASPSSMTSDNRSAVFWFGMVAIVGSASLNGLLVAEASDDKGFAVLCDPASGTAMTGPRGTDHPAQVGTMFGSFRSLKPRP